MLALFGNFGPQELVLIGIVAVLVFGKDLPQAASKAYLQLRKLRNAVDDLRRDSGIEREIRDIERSVREAEWEARRKGSAAVASASRGETAVPRRALPAAGVEGAAPSGASPSEATPTPAPSEGSSPGQSDAPAAGPAPAPGDGRGGTPTDAAS